MIEELALTYESKWVSPSAAAERLMRSEGCSQEQAKRDICRALSDGVIEIRAKLARHAVRPSTSSAAVSGNQFNIPTDLKPDDIDWQASRPVKPWFVRDVPRHHHGPWHLAQIELYIADVAKLGSGQQPTARPSAPEVDAPTKKQRARTQRESAIEAINAIWPNGVPSQHERPNALLERDVNQWLKQRNRGEVRRDTILRAAGRRK